MISQDKTNCSIEGNPPLIINEAANLMLNIAKTINKHTGVPEEEILSHIQQALQTNILIVSGMSIDEALAITDPKGSITRVDTIEKDGSTTILKEYNHE